MSRKFELVKSYYDKGLWNKEMVRNAVLKGVITEEDYEDITGNPYHGMGSRSL